MRPILFALPLLAAAPLAQSTVHHDSGHNRVVHSFKWQRAIPYDGSDPMGAEVTCRAERTFHATQYKLRDLQNPSSPWAPAMLNFLGWHPYPGSWDGVDAAGDDREYVIMEYTDVPLPAGNQNGDSVSPSSSVPESKATMQAGEASAAVPDEDKVVIFAAAALYEILPLWVAKGSPCEADFMDLSRYSSYVRDKAVVAWPVEHEVQPGKDGTNNLTFKILALSLAETDHGRAWREMWEKLNTQVRRQARKEQREQRRAARGQVDRAKDEL
ncbi:hypothetical protein VTK73DRAFT_6873 [Phialemonium thermophilum]|uniref:Uncharacterized protein n=1 Tax=Phialemonium thermophilum TaxID=223376 RepID=A0ABR3XUL9_9PEZI